MRIILTHEQADFDALASLLGATLLDPAAQPVLPRRMNRNVRAFVTLYGTELPFVDARDLPAETVETVMLVDTQNMATVKGVTNETQVHVVDHHALRADLPEHWTVATEEVGATVTLLIEQLRERDGALGTVQATLLLLGIYEDTGSLTYSRTTVRDLNAAAYLLEQGADLRIASDFLNHPLSLDQQEVYDALRENSETHDIHGYTVIVACGDAQEMDEELSTVAHKLRDLLDPDALFLLVTTRSGVQMIGRSTTDHIDVAEIAAAFGGGGHSRAAAALVRGRGLDEVCQELVEILPRLVSPALTVGEIMSHGLQVLAPETPAQQAAERMQRYGYEGYPVVRDGKVLGLLTRRAVDRALAHKLNLTAENLMNAGEVTVNPGDSIGYLQRLMTDTGWGQIPVVASESGQVIGIVTRTDLLKTLTTPAGSTGRPDLSARLEAALPPVRLALLKAVAQIAHEAHCAIYIVGGFVRDLMLDRPSLDFDLVVEGDAIALAQALQKRYGGRLKTHGRFGTAKWMVDGLRQELASALGHTGCSDDLPEFLDLITARTEFYTHPTALPTVESGSIKLDLHRRDFTINTLALRLDGYHYGELHDYWGGLNDLNSGLVRVLHSLSFVDDPTRMLRAVRFEQRFGFCIEERTQELLRQALPLLERISGDRVRHELDHILDETRSLAMLERLSDLGLLAAIHPGLQWDGWLNDRLGRPADPHFTDLVELVPPGGRTAVARRVAYCLWLLRLPVDRQRAVLARLKMPATQAKEIQEAARLWRDLSSMAAAAPSVIVARLEDVPPLAIYANCLAADETQLCTILRTCITRWRSISPTITGYDLQQRGLPPGPAYRAILGALRDAWLDGKVETVEQERVLFEALLEQAESAE